MGSFSCPHKRVKETYCLRLETDCVPGRPGCVLPEDTTFETPWQERVEKLEEERNRE